MKITKTLFKKLLKECILELQAEGKLGQPPSPQAPMYPQVNTGLGLGHGLVEPGNSRNLYEQALLDTLVNEMPQHRNADLMGMRVTGLAPPPMSFPPQMAGSQVPSVRPPPTPVVTQQPQAPQMLSERRPLPVVPVTDQTDLVPPGVAGMLPGAERWAQIAFSKRKTPV